MPKPAREIAGGLERKGFRKIENDHTFFTLWVDGKKTPIYTKISHGEKEVHDKLLGMMARQLALKRSQFLELIDCKLTEQNYVALLRQAGRLLSQKKEE